MKWMRLVPSFAVAACLACGAARAAEPAEETYGAEANPTGDPIGGGAGYSRIVTSGDYTVRTKEELVAALNQAQAGDVVYVAAERVDLSGLEPEQWGVLYRIPQGVTLAGNRGEDGAPGALLFSHNMPEGSHLLHANESARVTGLRIQGPDADIAQLDATEKPRTKCQAIWAVGPQVEIDNCEIMNFGRTGVGVTWSGRDVHIHHNHIHDVHAYPIGISVGTALVEGNLVEWVHHSVSGSGPPNSGYEARYNRFVRVASPEIWGGAGHHSHGFDMHGYHKYVKEKAYPGHVAGERILIHHNTMTDIGTPSFDVRIRGVPREIADIHHNRFPSSDPERAVSQSWVLDPSGGEEERTIGGNIWVHDNVYGAEQTLIPIGDPTTPQILFKTPGPPQEELEIVTGDLPLDIEVNAFEGLELKRVTIDVDGDEVYTGEDAPEPGAMVVDTRKLANGEHDLWVTAVDTRDGVARFFVRVLVQN